MFNCIYDGTSCTSPHIHLSLTGSSDYCMESLLGTDCRTEIFLMILSYCCIASLHVRFLHQAESHRLPSFSIHSGADHAGNPWLHLSVAVKRSSF